MNITDVIEIAKTITVSLLGQVQRCKQQVLLGVGHWSL